MTAPFVHIASAGQARRPFLRFGWTANRISGVYLLCLLPPLAAAGAAHGSDLLPVLAVSVLGVCFWQLVFGLVRRRAVGLDGLVTAAIFALLVGVSVPVWQVFLAVSFGSVLAEQIFGGRGFNFVNPAVAALVFLAFSFPGAALAPAPEWVSAATVPGALLLLWQRFVSWRMLVAALGGLLIALVLSGDGAAITGVFQGYALFILVFLACDPVTSAATNAGRWVNGLLVAGLIPVFAAGSGLSGGPQPYVEAVLVGSIFAPLIDAVVVLLNVRARRRRRG